LPVYTLPGAVDAVLTLDRPGLIEGEYALHEFHAGARFEVGPFRVDTWLLPHSVPNAGLRLVGADKVLAYTGDTGPSSDVVNLAQDANLFVAEASFPEQVPPSSARFLSSGTLAGRNATEAGVKRLLLTHVLPGTSREAVEDAARRTYSGELAVAHCGVVLQID
jgi:ribonuclease BN (tRNA processing enzyme)